MLDAYGCVYFAFCGDVKKAEEFFRKAIRANPYYDRGYAHLAIVAESRGDIKESAALYQAAIKMNPLNARARSNYAHLLKTYGGENLNDLGRLELKKSGLSFFRKKF